MRKFFFVCLLFGIVNTVEAQFWGGFFQGALMGAQNAMRQQQIRQQQERERRRQEEANKIEKELQIETGFKWYEVKQRGNVGAEDYYNNTLIPLSRGYSFICFHSKEGHVGYFSIQKNGKCGACDITGKEVISPSYESVFYASDGFNYKNSSGSYVPTGWYLDSEGKATREVPINKDLKTESDGFKWYIVRQGDKYGAEDYYNNTLIPLSRNYTSIYYNAEEGHKGYFRVMKGDKYGACDLTGKEIASPIYESLIYVSDGFEYKDYSGDWVALGWQLDAEGKAFQETRRTITYNGSKFIIIGRKSKYGLIDSNGKEIIPIGMDAIEQAGTGYLRYRKDNAYGIMNYQGKSIIPSSRGYMYISDYNGTRKRFSYTMEGFEGECNHLGQQLTKKKSNSVPYSELLTFDLKGNVRKYTYENKTREFDQNGKALTSGNEQIVYDSRGRIAEIKVGIDGFGGGNKYEYDSNGRVGMERTVLYLLGSEVESRSQMFYNSRGEMIKCIITDSRDKGQSVVLYSNYVYDSHGNWISRKKDGSVIESRTIEYY